MGKHTKINWGGCGGFFMVPVAVSVNGTLTDTSKKVLSYLISLWGCCDTVHPSTEKLMEVTFSSERSVKRAKSQLVELGLISIIHQGSGRGDASIYRINEKRINDFLGVELFIPASQETEPTPGDGKTRNKMKKLN